MQIIDKSKKKKIIYKIKNSFEYFKNSIFKSNINDFCLEFNCNTGFFSLKGPLNKYTYKIDKSKNYYFNRLTICWSSNPFIIPLNITSKDYYKYLMNQNNFQKNDIDGNNNFSTDDKQNQYFNSKSICLSPIIDNHKVEKARLQIERSFENCNTGIIPKRSNNYFKNLFRLYLKENSDIKIQNSIVFFNKTQPDSINLSVMDNNGNNISININNVRYIN